MATVVHRNEFESIAEAVDFQRAFPFCGTCKGTVKLQSIRGVALLLCIINPFHHDISAERIGAK